MIVPVGATHRFLLIESYLILTIIVAPDIRLTICISSTCSLPSCPFLIAKRPPPYNRKEEKKKGKKIKARNCKEENGTLGIYPRSNCHYSAVK